MVHLEVMYVSKDFLKHFCVLRGKKGGGITNNKVFDSSVPEH